MRVCVCVFVRVFILLACLVVCSCARSYACVGVRLSVCWAACAPVCVSEFVCLCVYLLVAWDGGGASNEIEVNDTTNARAEMPNVLR